MSFLVVSAACLIVTASPVVPERSSLAQGLLAPVAFAQAAPARTAPAPTVPAPTVPAPTVPAQKAPAQGSSGAAPPTAAAPPAASTAPTQAVAYYEFLRGRHLESLGRASEALEAYELAAKADPRSAQIRAEVAALHARNNQPEEAITAARAALTLDPDNAEAHWVLGSVYAALVEARDEVRAGIQVRGQTPDAASPSGAPGASGAAGAISVPSPEAIIGHLEKARPSRLYDNSLHLTLGRLYLDQKNWAKAIDVVAYVVEREPGQVDAALMLAQAHEGAGRLPEALTTLEETVAADPESTRALVYLGEMYARLRKWDEAAGAYERAAAQRPGVLDLRVRQASALVSAGRGAAARDLLREVAEAQPKEPRVLYMLAEIERSLQDYTAAEATARKLMALAPKQPFGYHALAQVYAQRHDYRQVIATLAPIVDGTDPATAVSRAYGPIYVSLGYAYQELGEFDKAIAAFERAREAGGGDDVAYDAYLVQANLAAGRKTKAVELAAAASAREPDNIRLKNLEAQARLQNGEPTKAIDILERAVAAHPDDVQAHVALAGVLSEAREYAKAEDVLTRAAGKFPEDINVPFQLGAVFEEQNRPADAERAFRQALKLDPQHAPTLNYLGYMLAERGQRLDEAVTLIAQAVQIEPDNGSYLDSLGWAYFKQGQLEKAREYLVKAGEQMPQNSVVQEHVGDVLIALRQVDAAVAAWRRALSGDGRAIDRASIEKKIAQARQR